MVILSLECTEPDDMATSPSSHMAMEASTSSCMRRSVLIRRITWMLLKLEVKVINLFCLVMHQGCVVGLSTAVL